MAASAVEVGAGVDTKIWDVTATADADSTISIPHGLAFVPEIVVVTWLTAAARVSQWLYTVDATNLNLFKTTGVGSGAAQAQVRVMVSRRVTANR